MSTTLEESLFIDHTVMEQAHAFRQTNARLEARGVDDGSVRLPEELRAVLSAVVEAMATGATITIGRLPRELTTTEAAQQLGMSRPTLMKLVKEGALPSHKVGSHTRLLRDDVLAFREQQRERSREIFEKRQELEDQIEFES